MTTRTTLLGATCLLLSAAPAAAQTAQSTPAPAAPPSSASSPPPAAPGGPEVVVTGQRSTLRTSIDRLSYDVANDLQTQTGSAADALRNVPGVEVDAQGNVSLRGDANVVIMVDGRPSGAFRGDGAGDALQQFPADQISRIEVITNPNAAMSPEGTAGVINIVTKRDRAPGIVGSARASVGTEGRYNLGLTASRTGRKTTISGDIGFRAAGGETTDDRDRSRLNTATGTFVEERSRTTSDTTGGGFRNARLAIDYDPDPKNRLSAELSYRGFGIESDAVERFDSPARAYDRFVDGSFDRGGPELRASWRRRYDEPGPTPPEIPHEFTLDLTLERTEFNRDIDARFTNRLPASAGSVQLFRYDTVSEEGRLKAEYVTPTGGGASLRAGVEYEQETNDYDNFGARGATFDALTVDPALTNAFAYEQRVGAAFAIYEKPFGKWTAQGGLRFEQVDIETNQKTTNVTGSNDYSRAYPTVFVTYDLTDNQRLRASYSRRIERPRAQDLNPFRVFIDPQNFRQGNPDLEPEITDSYEAGYQFRRGQTFYLATLFYRDSSAGVTDVIRPIGDGTFLTTRENLSTSRRAGLELVANGRFTRTLSYNLSGSALWNEIDAAAAGVSGGRDGTSYSGRFSLNWQPTDKDFFQVNGFLNGEQLQAQGVREAAGVLSLGYRRKVNERLSLVLTGNNVLDSFKEVVRIDTPTLRERTERNFIPPGVFLGVTWALGDVARQGQNRRGRQDPGFDFETGGGGPG